MYNLVVSGSTTDRLLNEYILLLSKISVILRENEQDIYILSGAETFCWN